MSIHLQLPVDVEHELLNRANQAGFEVNAFILNAIKLHLKNTRPQKEFDEAALLQKINKGFSEAFWEKYHFLVAKKDNESIASNEMEQLIQLTTQIEEYNVIRLEAAYELALLRDCDPKTLMAELGILKSGQVL